MPNISLALTWYLFVPRNSLPQNYTFSVILLTLDY
uniref:Uncharacterized protein n=1 Tax=Mesocestoides corti TaxID=53468 RepID=A0A5K3FVW8_MESCO